jgi:hypothetical protein
MHSVMAAADRRVLKRQQTAGCKRRVVARTRSLFADCADTESGAKV